MASSFSSMSSLVASLSIAASISICIARFSSRGCEDEQPKRSKSFSIAGGRPEDLSLVGREKPFVDLAVLFQHNIPT